MSASVVGQALTFGVGADEGSLITESITVVQTSDKKEARNRTGDVIAVAYYNQRTEITIKGLGASAATVGATLSLSGSHSPVGTLYIDEITLEHGNEEFVASELKCTAYTGISS